MSIRPSPWWSEAHYQCPLSPLCCTPCSLSPIHGPHWLNITARAARGNVVWSRSVPNPVLTHWCVCEQRRPGAALEQVPIADIQWYSVCFSHTLPADQFNYLTKSYIYAYLFTLKRWGVHYSCASRTNEQVHGGTHVHGAFDVKYVCYVLHTILTSAIPLLHCLS